MKSNNFFANGLINSFYIVADATVEVMDQKRSRDQITSLNILAQVLVKLKKEFETLRGVKIQTSII